MSNLQQDNRAAVFISICPEKNDNLVVKDI